MDELTHLSVGQRIKHWRTKRGLSQLDLALECDTSTRHLSFIETGKSLPARELLIAFTDALDVPLISRNNLLISAGYAPLLENTGLKEGELAEIRKVMSAMIDSMNPHPASIVDLRWNIIGSNTAFERVASHFVADQSILDQYPLNMTTLLCHPKGLAPAMENFSEVYDATYGKVHRVMAVIGETEPVKELLRELKQFRPADASDEIGTPQVTTTVRLNKDGQQLNLTNVIASLGSPFNIILQELQLDIALPADAASKELLEKISRDEV